jgi:AcrR family transcriptional regulator
LERARLTRADRRDVLLDTAAALVAEGDIEAVSMDAVAEGAGVSRPLVYKHFPNRTALLAELYRRESALLHVELTAAVSGARTVEDMFRALIHGALEAQATRGATFAALRSAGLRTSDRREEQRGRDRTTLRYFVSKSVRQFELDEPQGSAAVAILLRAIDSVLAQWRTRPTKEYAALLEDTYVALVVGGLDKLAATPKPSQRRTTTRGEPW